MRVSARLRQRARRSLIIGAVAVVAAQLALTVPARAEARDWQAEVAAIPTTRYARDAKLSISETEAAVRPLLDDLGRRRYEPVLADCRPATSTAPGRTRRRTARRRTTTWHTCRPT